MDNMQAAELEMPRDYSDHILCKQVLWPENREIYTAVARELNVSLSDPVNRG